MAFSLHVRRHWKKYVGGQVVGMLLTSYLIRKLRERNVVRAYCNVAKTFGEKQSSMLEKPKKIFVFLNRAADNSDAKIQFAKYAAPLLYLSGMDVTVVESEYQGHIQMLMSYVDPSSDGIIVAGGDGTVMEVLNGLMQRQDAEVARHMVMGILPLGRNNNTFKSLFPSADGSSRARRIGEATMCILHGLTRQVPVVEIHPEKGRTKFSLSSVQWGAFREAFSNKDRFWIFGKLRLLASYVSTALRRWPEATVASAWTFHSPHTPFSTSPESSPALQSSPAVTVGRECSSIKEDIAGFKLTPSDDAASLRLTLWPLALLPKSAFLSHGWCMTTKGECEVPGANYSSPGLSLSPPSDLAQRPSGQLLSVDGEDFEAIPMQITLRKNHITIFT